MNLFKNKSLRFSIASIFFSLMALLTISIIWFTYLKQYKSILNFSHQTIQRVGVIIGEKMDSLIDQAEMIDKSLSNFLRAKEQIALEDLESALFLLYSLRSNPMTAALYFGIPDGSILSVHNLSLNGQTNYLSKASEPLPVGSVYNLRILDHSKSDPSSIYTYFDKDLNPTGTETVLHDPFDSRNRPWYPGAISQKTFYWTDVYLYNPSEIPGVTVANAARDKEGKLIAIAGVDISFSYLDPFMKKQLLEKSGSALLLDINFQPIIPEAEKNSPLTKEAIDFFKQDKQTSFIFEHNSQKYLASIKELRISFTQHWYILIIAPFTSFFYELIETQLQIIWISAAMLIFATLFVVYFAKTISKPIVALAKETDKIGKFELESNVRIESSIKEVHMMDVSIATMRSAIRSFSHYIPKEVVKQLIQSGQEISLGGEKKEITVLFSDISGFTAITEVCSAEELIILLAEYFQGFSQIIFRHAGTIDKYIGDGVMAFWGAPLSSPDHAEQACAAALECQAFIRELNQSRKTEGKPVFETRIGINTGMAIVGNIGTEERINYTAMGDSVNVAARLENINKNYHTSTIISEEVFHKINSHFLTRPLDITELRGKKIKTKIFELLPNTPENQELSSQFAEAFEAFQTADLKRAATLFEALRARFPDDYPTQLYLERLRQI